MDAVAPGLRPHIDDRIAHARRGAVEDLVRLRDAHGHGVDQDVAVIGGVEIHLAAHGRHAHAIAVAADAAHHAADEMLHLRSEEHTSELQSLMRISYAVLCLKKTT